MTTYRVTATANDEPTTDDIEAESPDQAWAEACKKHRLVRLYNGKVEELPTRAELLARITALETAGQEANDRLLMFRITSKTSNVLIWDRKDETAYQELAALLGETK